MHEEGGLDTGRVWLTTSDFRLYLCADREAWNRGLLAFPSPHVLQTWEWGEVKAQTGWRAFPLLFERKGEVVAQALVLRRPIPFLPLALGYVPKGPTLDWQDTETATAVLRALVQVARRLRLLFLKIDPDVPRDAPTGQRIVEALRGEGWRFSPQQIQFRNTVLVDLNGDEDALLARMKPKWRYNIRLARRRGVNVWRGTVDDLPVFYDLYRETALRDGFLIRPYAYYEHTWRHFLERNKAALLLAEWEGRFVAGLMLFLFGRRAWYMYGASAAGEARRHMPNHLLQWEAMRLARERGCTVYDMWGAPDELVESDPMWGVYRFKQGFGGELQRWIGAWDYPLYPALYQVYAYLLPQAMHGLSRALVVLRRRLSRSP